MEFCSNPNLIKKWKKLIRKEAKEAKKAGRTFDPSQVLEVTFLRSLIEEFLEILDSKVIPQNQMDDEPGHKRDAVEGHLINNQYNDRVDDSCVLYCERFMEFLIDLLSQLPTRRFLKAVVTDVAAVAKCHLSTLYQHEKGRLFAQLVDLLQFYEGFEIDDHVGTQLSDDDVLLSHYSRLQAFQLLAFKQIPKLRELALCHIGAIHKRADLSKKLSVLSAEELQDLVCNKLKLVSDEDPCAKRIDFLIEVMLSFFEKRQSQKEAINALPLYPNEKIMWDESVVPSINYSGEGCLALPKLNLQFLTLHDYLLRNFNLFRLESTYEICEDIQEAIPHLLAYINSEGDTAFRGWSRMAVPIKEFKITDVKQPNIGEVKPSSVTARVTLSISSYKAHIRFEWNALKEHDVVFLLSIRPSFEPLGAEEAANSTVPERLGLQYVRGCEVIEIYDEGVLMNDFTGRIKRDEWKPPKGELRTVTVALDTAQYHMDVNTIAEKGGEGVYGTFNILMRRKPKENNFKAILESIRDLMNEYCIIPDWLHNIFLGYGDPSAAQWTNMPDLLEVVDFKDTFLDANHLKDCFSDYLVSFVGPDGVDDMSPHPPFRIRIPKEMKNNTYALPGNKSVSAVAMNDGNIGDEGNEKEKLVVESYIPADPGPYPQDMPKQNSVRFTTTQMTDRTGSVKQQLSKLIKLSLMAAFPNEGNVEPIVALSPRKTVDYQCNNAMGLFREIKGKLLEFKSPNSVGQAIAKNLPPSHIIESTSVAGPGFVNIILSSKWVAQYIQGMLLNGIDTWAPLLPVQRAVVDFSSPNIAKEMHVGHLRSTIIGDTLARMLEFSKVDVLRRNHVGDWGTQFGMLIEHLFDTYSNWEDAGEQAIGDLQEFYKASKKRFDEDSVFKERAQKAVVLLQGGEHKYLSAWKKICEISRKEFDLVYKRLGVQLEEMGESFYNPYIPGVIEELTNKGLVKESQGAQVIFIEGQRIPLIVVKSDGGFNYASTDLTALWYRINTEKVQWIIYVTDVGQQQHFGMVFSAARLAGWLPDKKDLYPKASHVGFGLVLGSDGKRFRTRSSEVVRLVELLDEARNRSKVELRDRRQENDRLPDWTDEELEETAEAVGYGAVKYADLKNNKTTNYTFSFEQMLNDKGNTAVYLLYAHARICSIIRKSGKNVDELIKTGTIVLAHPDERVLGLNLIRFAEIVEEACTTLLPNVICEYLYNLSEIFTSFYANCKVVGSEEEESRLLLCEATAVVMRKCFFLLGIKPVYKI